jgi:hypothetical protein
VKRSACQEWSERAYNRLIVEASYRLPASPTVRGLSVPLTIERIWAGTPFVPETYFSWALCQLNACRSEPRSWRRGMRYHAIGLIRRKLGQWAAQHPRNYRHRATLVEAEWLRYRGQACANATGFVAITPSFER